MTKATRPELALSLAGMDLGGIRAPPGHWPIPASVESVTRDCGELLAFHWPLGRTPAYTQGARGMLREFIRIRDAASALAFARAWGPLGLCRHGVPWIQADLDTEMVRGGAGCVAPECQAPEATEPVEACVRLAAGAAAILSVAAA